jgi:hypothetical protein
MSAACYQYLTGIPPLYLPINARSQPILRSIRIRSCSRMTRVYVLHLNRAAGAVSTHLKNSRAEAPSIFPTTCRARMLAIAFSTSTAGPPGSTFPMFPINCFESSVASAYFTRTPCDALAQTFRQSSSNCFCDRRKFSSASRAAFASFTRSFCSPLLAAAIHFTSLSMSLT